MQDFEQDTSVWELTYNQELKTLLAEQIGAKEIIIFDHTVRIDDPNAGRKPARNVHSDYSPFGITGSDLSIGADILTRAALEDEFETASGQYFDNDVKRFASPHPDALDLQKSGEIMRVIETVLARLTQ